MTDVRVLTAGGLLIVPTRGTTMSRHDSGEIYLCPPPGQRAATFELHRAAPGAQQQTESPVPELSLVQADHDYYTPELGMALIGAIDELASRLRQLVARVDELEDQVRRESS